MSASLRAPFSAAIKELRIQLCQSSQGSAGVRSFLSKSYPDIKKANPTLPILIREARGTEARAFARYDMGVERKISLEGLDEARIADKLADFNSGVNKA
ncbi:putative nadh-ubiquinone oxidoreductase 10.5 kDa subunit [Catenaria anguillulae PL171]|uniref:Putative nadh-ubiquinone oxidoreductase 10.5 kDa subunit n=1 Tax=Catenaria anguillulae PL171 TaxID=765915 RepID=A0A1Y2I0B6_9FUNG|nr:putative nadh-ubiquinone oxidoreductase 10.5 kDa subunit [Catenaria anguillulae PL171]